MRAIAKHTTPTARLRVAYRRRGDGDGLPMLLVHGSYASSRWWEPLMSVLPYEILAVAPDLRGCGDSEHLEDGYHVPDLAADLEAFVGFLGWTEFDLVAHSSGGAVAVEYTLANLQCVRTLTLVDSVPAEGVFTPLDTYLLLERMRTDQHLLEQAMAALMPTFAGIDATSNDDDRAFFRQLVDDASQMASPAFTAMADGLARWNRFGDLGQLSLPTLLVWGDLDLIVDRDATTRTLIAIPGAHNMEVLHNVGHSPMIEAPVGLAERIIEFISDDLDDYGDVRRMGLED